MPYNKTNFMKTLSSYNFLICISIVSLFFSCTTNTTSTTENQDLTQYVDPYIGTGEHGHVFLGANIPFGLVQLGPTNISEGWDWVSGYHISDSTIWAFTHLHLSGTGIGDLLDIGFMPVIGDVKLGKGIAGDQASGMYCLFSRDKEIVRPGFYAVHLDRYDIDVELTSTNRVGFHKYTFPKSEQAKVIIDLKTKLNWDEPTETYLICENDSTVSGYRFSKGWADNQKIFFTAIFSKPMKDFLLSEGDDDIQSIKELKAKGVFGQAHFNMEEEEDLFVKVALSPTSIENAKLNMKAELPDWNFEETIAAADKTWNEELNKIQIKTEDSSIKRTFYTGLYHTMIAPSTFCDVNGDYYGADNEMHKGADFVNHTTFSLWDTYRAAHPLMTIIHPEKMSDMVKTMLNIYNQQNKLPVWHLMGCETNTMVGNPGICVMADAIMKGYVEDKETAYESLKKSAMLDERGMDFRKKYGYIPYDKMRESVAYDMEYALADWSIAQVAQMLNKQEDYTYFNNRSQSYKNFFDPKTGFMRGKGVKGEFHEPFNPFASSHRDDDYCEGNAWQYTFLVPHDLSGLIECFGSKESFIEKLDSLFIVDSNLVGDDVSPDISGLIGQYAHGNEPSHHVIYFYSMIGQPHKTAALVRRILTELYNDTPTGISGNEDVGQMSAWYILSALGMYQVEPAGGKYVFGSPIIDEAVIKVNENQTFTIKAINNSKENIYIQNIKLNGQEYNKYYILFEDIMKGGTLEFTMGNQPSDTWG